MAGSAVEKTLTAACLDACRADNARTLRRNLKKFPSGIDECRPNGFPVLHLAARYGSIRCLRVLSDLRVDVNQRDQYGKSALHHAIRFSHVKIIRYLVKRRGANLNIQINNGPSPLHLACSIGEAGISEYLIKHGADPNAKTRSGYTPLHYACQYGYFRVVEMLLKYKVDVNAVDKNSNTPLNVACSFGRFRVVAVLLDMDARMREPPNSGEPPLRWLHQFKNPIVLSFLVGSGACYGCSDEIMEDMRSFANRDVKTRKALMLGTKVFEDKQQRLLKVYAGLPTDTRLGLLSIDVLGIIVEMLPTISNRMLDVPPLQLGCTPDRSAYYGPGEDTQTGSKHQSGRWGHLLRKLRRPVLPITSYIRRRCSMTAMVDNSPAQGSADKHYAHFTSTRRPAISGRPGRVNQAGINRVSLNRAGVALIELAGAVEESSEYSQSSIVV